MRKVWQQLKREGYIIARCTVARLMQKLGIQGVWRGKNKQTTRSRDDQKRADDLVKRNFNADHPDQLWVSDFTYIQTALLHKDLKCKAPLIEPNLRRNLGKWAT